MKRLLVAVLAVACAGVGGFVVSDHNTPNVAIAQDAPVEKIKNIDAHLKADKDYQAADFVTRLNIVAEMLKAKEIDWNQARGAHMREVLANAKANERDPATNLVAFVQWAGAELKNYKGDIRKACGSSGGLDSLMEVYGAQRLYKDETFLKGDTIAKLARIKELWEARELAQGQCYELTAMYIYEYLADAKGDIDKQIEMFGKLSAAKCMDWAGSANVHDALLTRALEEKKDLDTVEKKLEWIGKRTDSKTGELSWMVVSRRRTTLFMHAMDATMAGLNLEERVAKIDDYQKKGLLGSSDANDLKAAYCEVR